MNEKIVCEKCGTEMIPIDESKPIGMTCPNCGWGWATTYISDLQEDSTIYNVSLIEGNSTSIEVIKAIAKISNKNSVEAKKMIETPPAVIFSGKAVQVKAVLALLDSLLIAYTVTPEFPYSLTQES